MAFPAVPTVAASRVLTTTQANSTATRTFPDLSSLTKNNGDLLIAIVVAYQSSTTNAQFGTWGGGFTEFHDSGTSTTMAIGAAYKWSDGTETGTFTVTQAGTVTGDAIMFLLSIPGAHATTPPEAGGRASGTTTVASPGAFDPTGWDVEDTLWIIVAGSGETSTTGSYTGITAGNPANYTDNVTVGISRDVVGAVGAAIAFRQLAAASEDAPNFANDISSARWGAIEIAIRPAPSITTVNGVVTSDFGGILDALGVDRKVGVVTSTFGGTLDAVGTTDVVGVVTSTFGGTLDAVGIDRAVGVVTSDFGGTLTTAGNVPTSSISGVVTSLFGGTFTTIGAVAVGTTPPTRIGAFIEATTGNYTNSTSPKSAAQRTDLLTGDLVVITASAADGSTTLMQPSHTGTASITWTQLVEAPASANMNVSYICAWQGEVTADGTMTLTVTKTGGNVPWGFSGALYRDHGGIGNVNIIANTTTASPQMALTCSDNSAMIGQINDWNAVNGSARTWLSVNGVTLVESLYVFATGLHTVYGARSADVGAAGSKTFGLSAPTGQRPAIVVVEVKGVTEFGAPAVSGVVTTTFGGTFVASGIPRTSGVVASTFGGTLTTSGFRRLYGTSTNAFGGTLNATGIDRAVGTVTSLFGGTFTTAGINTAPPVTGVVSSSFGGTFTTTGIDRVVGSVASNFGGAFLGVGNDRQFGAAVSMFGGTIAVAGRPRKQSVAVSSFGFTSTAAGVDRALGAVTALFGGTLDVAGVPIPPAGTGAAVSLFGGTFTTTGVRRRPGSVSSNFGGAFLGAGNDRNLGAATSAFGFTSASNGVSRTRGAATSAFGGTFVVLGNDRALGQTVSLFGGTFTTSSVRRRRGVVASNFGGAFLGAGNDRQFGSSTSLFGFTSVPIGVRRTRGAVTSSFALIADVNGKRVVVGHAISLFGGSFNAQSQPSTIFFLSAGVFTPMEMSRAEGGVWTSSSQTILSV